MKIGSFDIFLNGELYAPSTYWQAPLKDKEAVTNGCGPESKLAALVPNHFYGLDMDCVCDIHDWMYTYGESYLDKLIADMVFFLNCALRIDANSNWLTMIPRYTQAAVYFVAVHKGGDGAFWAEKEKPREDPFIWRG